MSAETQAFVGRHSIETNTVQELMAQKQCARLGKKTDLSMVVKNTRVRHAKKKPKPYFPQ